MIIIVIYQQHFPYLHNSIRFHLREKGLSLNFHPHSSPPMQSKKGRKFLFFLPVLVYISSL
jgi:hypothetical protein